MSEWVELHLRHDHRHGLQQTLYPRTTTSPPDMTHNSSADEEVELFSANATGQWEDGESVGWNYTVAVPIMLLFCLLTAIVNLVIVVSARWCRKPMSPTLHFSISLALADAYASLVLGLGLLVNSLLPKVYGIQLDSDCVPLTLEVFRLGGILVSNVHLLALAINHWIGIVRPLHYPATMTRRTAWTVIVCAWVGPILLVFGLFSSTKGLGFLSKECRGWGFLEERAFRSLFASLFFAPLILMSLIYLHIFSIVRSNQKQRLRFQSSQQLRRNLKAVMTTVLILGTYVLGFLPATLYNILVCNNCVVQLHLVPLSVRECWGVVVNTLVILKALVDPVIYAARMTDIQVALKKMRYDALKNCGSCVEPLSPQLERGFSTKYHRSQSQETRSVRASSLGSNSSWRRPERNSLNSLPQHATKALVYPPKKRNQSSFEMVSLAPAMSPQRQQS